MNEASANTSAEPIDIVLPAHNEGDGIAQTIKEFDEIVRVKAGIPIRFVVCEDGSTDNTVEVLTRLSSEHPIHLVSSTNRKGYSRAVVDGLNESTSEIVGFIDSDGQCDPTDFPVLHAAIPDFDLVVGYRNPRKDALYRKAMSQSFKLAYQQLFPVRLRDPSCPFLLVHRPSLELILRGHPGLLRQGFWWEFNARAQNAGLRVTEVPVQHRERTAGVTKVYRPQRIPAIAADHLKALFELRRELKSLPAPSRP